MQYIVLALMALHLVVALIYISVTTLIKGMIVIQKQN
jgi:hypothetical protein